MKETSSDKHEPNDLILYPTNRVVGIIDAESDARAALHDLKAAGFTAKEVDVVAGEEGAHRLDPTGKEHGPFARFVRWIEKAGDMEPRHVKRYKQEVLEGHVSIAVLASEPEARQKVRRILKAHNGHFINFYGEWVIEELDE